MSLPEEFNLISRQSFCCFNLHAALSLSHLLFDKSHCWQREKNASWRFAYSIWATDGIMASCFCCKLPSSALLYFGWLNTHKTMKVMEIYQKSEIWNISCYYFQENKAVLNLVSVYDAIYCRIASVLKLNVIILCCFSWWAANSTWSWTLWSRTRRTSATCWSCSTIVRPVCRSVHATIYIFCRIKSPLRLRLAFPFLMSTGGWVTFLPLDQSPVIGSAAPKHRRINNEADLWPGRSAAAAALDGISLILHCAMRAGAAERVRAVVRKIIHEIQNSVTLCEQLYFRRLRSPPSV